MLDALEELREVEKSIQGPIEGSPMTKLKKGIVR